MFPKSCISSLLTWHIPASKLHQLQSSTSCDFFHGLCSDLSQSSGASLSSTGLIFILEFSVSYLRVSSNVFLKLYLLSEPGQTKTFLRPWCREECGSIVPFLKIGICLARPLIAGARALGELLFHILRTQLLPHSRAVAITPKAAVCLVCGTREISCVPFVQHCLNSFLLTSSHCVIAFCWLCPIFPWK